MTQYSDLLTRIRADNTQFFQATRQVREETSAVTTLFEEMGRAVERALVVGTVFKFIGALNSLKNKYAEMWDQSQKLGTSFEQFQELSFIAEQNGVAVDILSKSISKLQDNLGKFKAGDKFSNALDVLGIDPKELKSLDTEGRILKISKAIKNVQDQDRQVALLNGLFSRGGKELLSTLNGELDQTIKKYKDLGLAISNAEGKQIDEISDREQQLKQRWQTFYAKKIAAASPFLIGAMDTIDATSDAYDGMRDVNGMPTLDLRTPFVGVWEGLKALQDLTGISHDTVVSGDFWGPATKAASKYQAPLSQESKLAQAKVDVLDFVIPKVASATEKTGQELEKFAASVEKAGRRIRDVVEDAGKDLISKRQDQIDSIDSLLGTNDSGYLSNAAKMTSDLPQLQSLDFNGQVRDVLEYAKANGSDKAGIQRQIDQLRGTANDELAYNGFGWTDRNTYKQTGSNSEMIKAVDQLQRLLLGEKEQKINVNVKIEADENGVFRAVTSNTSFETVIGELAKRVVAKEARGVAR